MSQHAELIDRETAIALAKKAGFKASIGQTVDDKYHPDKNAIGKSVPVEWVERLCNLAVAHSRKDAPVVAYQYRMKPEWHDAWVKWQPCEKANFDDYVKAPVVNGWNFEARALYAKPPEAADALQAMERKPMTTNDVWRSDDLMAVNAEIQLGMHDLMRLVRTIEAHHGIKGE